MITFKKYLNESEVETFDTIDPQDIAKAIKTDCIKWLKEVGDDVEGHLIYRGMNLSIKTQSILLQRNVRMDRRPRDTRKDVHEIFDRYFKDRFGINYRTQSMFVSGNNHIVADYGHPYIVFPIGDYDYCWSIISDDLMYYFEHEVRNRAKKLHKAGKITDHELDLIVYPEGVYSQHPIASPWNITKINIDHEKFIYEILDDAKFTDSNLHQGIKSGHEIMINCKNYYILNNINSKNIQIINEVLDIL